MNKLNILKALHSFVNQRPGFELNMYDSMSSYRSDYRKTLQAKHDFAIMMSFVKSSPITADNILYASENAFMGRLSITIEKDDITLDYTAGQSFPTEYRNAACAVLAYAMHQYWRDSGQLPIWNTAVDLFGKGLSGRWFN